MKIVNKIKINAPIDKVWNILSVDFSRVSHWTSAVITSTENPDLPKGDGRQCELPDGAIASETLLNVDNKRLTFSYEVKLSSMPFFVKSMINTWHVEENGKGQSRVTFEIAVTLLPVFTQIMGPLMKKQFNKLANMILDELKYFSETGKIHPRKEEQRKTSLAKEA
ncbi:SRPBCC family protein [Microbulbifer sp. OS29]|uniref:SRPBCC family protein n=1 Tax=Microbulbifer okhotskensis TaxID=2926617 RepID=A0A9X2J7E1_9GAMM|nr:SRPBCC family protein [Microbulbifer okhotskensis]MCO1335700.1 SRPBCC family protein [Microbulbifer okhotskensis]